MKRIFGMAFAVAISSAATLLSSAPSLAQGSWTGLYLGLQAGHGWGSTSSVATTDGGNFPLGTRFPTGHSSGFLGGGQVGYNYQMGTLVLGIEGDLAATAISGRNYANTAITGRYNLADEHYNWLGTATARLGFAQGAYLWYVKGGWAWADISRNATTINANGSINNTSVGSESRDGWTVGAGMEYRFNGPWSLKGEYNYVDLGKAATTGLTTTGAGAGTTFGRDRESQLHIGKLGLNYKF